MFVKFIRDKKGSVFVELILELLIVSLIILTAVHLFDVAIKYQHVSFTSKEIAKVVELEGALTASAWQHLDSLNDSFNMDMTFAISGVTYFDPVTRAIQFKDTFTITVNFIYHFPIFDPIFTAAPVMINIPMRADVQGMSEVYWKP